MTSVAQTTTITSANIQPSLFKSSTHQQSWGGEGEARVLHSSIGETGWQDEDVIDAPDVGAAQLLSLLEHRLSLAEVEGSLHRVKQVA